MLCGSAPRPPCFLDGGSEGFESGIVETRDAAEERVDDAERQLRAAPIGGPPGELVRARVGSQGRRLAGFNWLQRDSRGS